MNWSQYALLGAGGGALVEVLAIYQSVLDWQSARKDEKTGGVLVEPPKLKAYLDFGPHACMFVLRGLLGSVTGGLLGVAGKVHNVYTAFGAGCAAPVIVASLGTALQQYRQLQREAHERREASASRATLQTDDLQSPGAPTLRADSSSGGRGQ
jgi:hypothetical protein